MLASSRSVVMTVLPGRGALLSVTQLAALDVPVRRELVEHLLPDGGIALRELPVPIWVEPHAAGQTPMCEALRRIRDLAAAWCAEAAHAASFPPIVFNITDGEATDGTPEQLAAATQKLRALETADGAVLLLNIHLSGSEAQPILFPSSEEEMPENRYARLLYRISSPMPVLYRDEIALLRGRSSTEIPRGMGFNTNMTDLVRMMNIGTATSTLLL